MNWGNLKVGLCPKCGIDMGDIGHLDDSRMVQCPSKECDFIARAERIAEIVDNMGEKEMRGSMEGFGFE